MEMVDMYQGDANCGPVAVQKATKKPYVEILEAWPGEWSGIDNDKGMFFLPNDTPFDHFTVLEKLGVNYKNIPLSDVLEGRAVCEKTVLLLHIVNKPKNIWQRFLNFFKGMFKQHWVVLVSYDLEIDEYELDWGYHKTDKDGKAVRDIQTFSREQMELMLTTSFPNCAYTVGTETTDRISWIRKLYAKLV